MSTDTQISDNTDNFFVAVDTVLNEYMQTKEAISNNECAPKKKVYRSMEKLLKECYLTGSLLYGDNFIA